MISHYYYNIQGWFVQEKLFTSMVMSCNDTDEYHFVEIGSWKGRSSTFMGVEILNSGKNIKFDCIDTWEGSEEHLDKSSTTFEPLLLIKDGLYNEFLKNIRPIKSIINPIRSTSIEASKLYEDNSLDFVFIDGSHDYLSVKEDIEHWYPKVKKGGYISGDDYVHPPIGRAVREFFDIRSIIPIKEYFLGNVDQTWVVCKK
jgi:hypothetical protein